MNIFILEDDMKRVAKFNEMFKDHTVTHVTGTDEAINKLSAIKYDLILLDHDLGGRVYVPSTEYETGYRVACIIPTTINKDTKIIIHSFNTSGVVNMQNAMKKCADVKSIPFNTFDIKILGWE